ncbi:alpha/beta fold hydrolase, partial [Aquabacterium sp.]|uniref:alpha/beta fold hydrolase n=1 Tax=Aquabacterium sp. TaxID=1872578 RepID=UPI002BF51F05
MPILEVNGARINYVQLECQDGAGHEDLVMVHGLATNMAFWYFQYAARLSQKRFRVTLFDLRGHGRSEMSAGGYTPDNLARDLRELLDQLGIARAHFITHSYGGVVAMNLGKLDPRRIASLVLCDTHIAAVRQNARIDSWGHGAEIQAIVDQAGLQLDTRDPYFGYKLLTAVSQRQMSSAEVPSQLVELVSPLVGKYGNRTAAQWLKLMDSTSAERELMGDDGLSLDELRKFTFPILALYGDQSQARLTGKELLDVWPHADFRRVHKAGHFFPSSRSEEVIHACERFWGGEFAAGPKHRSGDTRRSHFRSDRVYQADGEWYFMTREQAQV